MISKILHGAFLAAACSLLVLVPGAGVDAGIGIFTVDPPEPGCDEQMTFHVEGAFGDGCWTVTEIEFFTGDETLGFIVHAFDGWQPGTECPLILVDYGDWEIVDPPPSGKYWGVAIENVQSVREEGDQAFVPILACCTGNEAPVTDLRLQKTDGGSGLKFTWSNVPGAENFHLYADENAGGAFTEQLASTAGFSIELPLDHLPGYFLLSQSSECGEGGKH